MKLALKKLSQRDKYFKYQRILEPYIFNLRSDFEDSVVDHSTIDRVFGNLIGIIQQVSNELPHTRFRKNLKPYWNSNLSALKYKKVMSYRRWVAEGRPR